MIEESMIEETFTWEWQDRIAALVALNAELQDRCDNKEEEIQAYMIEIAILKVALRFYALMQNYAPNQGGEPPSPVLQDSGQIARAAIAKAK